MAKQYRIDLMSNASNVFGNPFHDLSSKMLPRNLRSAFKVAEMVWNHMDSYRQGLQKIVRYFLTAVEIRGVSKEISKEWDVLLNQTMDIENTLTLLGDDYVVYGNSLSSLAFPFLRYLVCPRCSLSVRSIHVDYEYKDAAFHVTCPNCKFKGEFKVIDRRLVHPDKIHVIRWNLHEIDITSNPYGFGSAQYVWRIPTWFKQKISDSDPFFLDTTPLEFLTAAANESDVLINPKLVCHLKIENLSGIHTGGQLLRGSQNRRDRFFVILKLAQILLTHRRIVGGNTNTIIRLF